MHNLGVCLGEELSFENEAGDRWQEDALICDDYAIKDATCVKTVVEEVEN